MTGRWNYNHGESWKEYIQRSTITNDLTAAHRESSREMSAAISGQTSSILTGMENMESQIGLTMGNGFNMLAQEILELNAGFQWGFGQMIAQMGGMNDSLKSLIRIAKTPAQTAAYEQFEIARDAFRQGLYAECLESLAKAISGDHTSPGYKLEWRFHQLTGVIRLGFYGCDMDLIDPALAEQAFLMAARYARTDDALEAAKAQFSAGWCAYVQGKLPEALKYTEQSIALDSDLSEALFQAAKISMAAGKPSEGLPMLRKAIDQAPAYILKAAADGDFKSHEKDLNDFFEAMRNEAYIARASKLRTALAEAEVWAKDVCEVAECKVILGRWRSLLGGGWGLLDLLRYGPEFVDKDIEHVSSANTQGRQRLQSELEHKRNTFWIEARSINVEREIDENYLLEETFQKDVVVRPRSLFRKKQTRMANETRTVTKSRRVLRKTEEIVLVYVNGLGVLQDRFQEHFQFARIPAGEFLMGSPSGGARGFDEKQHKVTISMPFEMQIYPVTQTLWKAVMGCYEHVFWGPDTPVETVSWELARIFIEKLNKVDGANRYRLPTEAEWEYACRAGTTTIYHTGDSEADLERAGWYRGNANTKAQNVGEKMPNAWGLYDMHGNVREWCWDLYGEYDRRAQSDPQGASSGSHRVLRGGRRQDDAWGCRAAQRYGDDPSLICNGFRVVRGYEESNQILAEPEQSVV